jgi:serine/threonine protein kinase
MNHPGIIKLHTHLIDQKYLTLVMDYALNSDFSQFLNTVCKSPWC